MSLFVLGACGCAIAAWSLFRRTPLFVSGTTMAALLSLVMLPSVPGLVDRLLHGDGARSRLLAAAAIAVTIGALGYLWIRRTHRHSVFHVTAPAIRTAVGRALESLGIPFEELETGFLLRGGGGTIMADTRAWSDQAWIRARGMPAERSTRIAGAIRSRLREERTEPRWWLAALLALHALTALSFGGWVASKMLRAA